MHYADVDDETWLFFYILNFHLYFYLLRVGSVIDKSFTTATLSAISTRASFDEVDSFGKVVFLHLSVTS